MSGQAEMNGQHDDGGEVSDRSDASVVEDVSNSTNGYLTASQSSINNTVTEELPSDPLTENGLDDSDSDEVTVHPGNGYLTASEASIDTTDADPGGRVAPGALKHSDTATSFPSLNDDHSSSSPASPVLGRIKKSLRDKVRHMSGNKTNSTSTPKLDHPITREDFLRVHEHIKDWNEKAIEDYLNKSDLEPNDVLEERTEETALHVLCTIENASIKVFNALINLKHDLSKKTSAGYNILHYAVLKSHDHFVEEIMKKTPVLLYIQDSIGWTPFHLSVYFYKETAFNIFMKHATQVPMQTTLKGLTPLNLAVERLKGVADFLKENEVLLSEEEKHNGYRNIGIQERMIKALSNKVSRSDLTQALLVPVQYPLHVLADLKLLDHIRSIVERVKDPEVYQRLNEVGFTPFSLSLHKAKQSMQRLTSQNEHDDSHLLMKIEKEEVKKDKRRKTTTKRDSTLSSKELSFAIAQDLLKHMKTGMDDPVKDYYNMTPLQMVLHRVGGLQIERDIVDMLLQKGARVLSCSEDQGEDAPIDMVGHNFRRDIFILFLDHMNKENINIQDINGSTVLHYAVRINDEEKITKLFEKEADPTLVAKVASRVRGGDIFHLAYPNTPIEAEFYEMTPLMISLLENSSGSYFRSLRRYLDTVVVNIPDSQLISFFQTHLVAAAATLEKKVFYIFSI